MASETDRSPLTRFAWLSIHVQVPGDWTVDRGHQAAGHVASDIRRALPEAHVATHLEPFHAPHAATVQPAGRSRSAA